MLVKHAAVSITRVFALGLVSLTTFASCQNQPNAQSSTPPLTNGAPSATTQANAQPQPKPGQPPQPSQQAAQPLGDVKAEAKVGPEKLNLEQVQAEVEAFADRIVIKVAQIADQAAREHPAERTRLHSLKLAVATGAYTIAAGPNPVVALLDLIVQVSLVRNSIESQLAAGLPGDAGQQFIDLFTRLHDQIWVLGARVLSEQEQADLRMLIEQWIQDNPNQVYVAGIRFSDFARLRPKEGRTQSTSIFGLLRLDPLSSLDPAAREIREARELAERVFYYSQRMPQIVSWQTERLFYEFADAQETRQMLANLDEFTKSTRELQNTVSALPADIRTELEQSETTVATLLDRVNGSLLQADQSAKNLKEASAAAADAGRAWEQTALAVGEVAKALAPPDQPDAATGEPVTLHDVIVAIDGAQATAVQLRGLLEELNATAQRGTIESSVATSATEFRRSIQTILLTATVCALVVVAAVLVAALMYRSLTRRRMTPRSEQQTYSAAERS